MGWPRDSAQGGLARPDASHLAPRVLPETPDRWWSGVLFRVGADSQGTEGLGASWRGEGLW